MRERRAAALVRVSKAASACALQQEALARAHLDTRGRSGLKLSCCAEPHHEAGALTGTAARNAARRKAGLVEAADDGRVLQQLVFAPHGKPAAPPSGAA